MESLDNTIEIIEQNQVADKEVKQGRSIFSRPFLLLTSFVCLAAAVLLPSTAQARGLRITVVDDMFQSRFYSAKDKEKGYQTVQNNINTIKDSLDDLGIYQYSIKIGKEAWTDMKLVCESHYSDAVLKEIMRASDIAIKVNEVIDGKMYEAICFINIFETRNTDSVTLAKNQMHNLTPSISKNSTPDESETYSYGYATYCGSKGWIIGQYNIAIGQFIKTIRKDVAFANSLTE